jgi:hypothetical protein
VIAALTILLAVILRLASGGRLLSLGELEIPRKPLILALFLLQGLARGRLPLTIEATRWAVLIWALVCVFLIAVLLPIRRVPGICLSIYGISSNLVVVLFNWGMPVHSGVAVIREDSFYRATHAANLLNHLGDVLPMPFGVQVSLGDLLLLVGICVLIIAAGVREPVMNIDSQKNYLVVS